MIVIVQSWSWILFVDGSSYEASLGQDLRAIEDGYIMLEFGGGEGVRTLVLMLHDECVVGETTV